MAERLDNYKNNGRTSTEFRRRRVEYLSKKRRDNKFNKLVARRNIDWKQLESPPGLSGTWFSSKKADQDFYQPNRQVTESPPVAFNQTVFNNVLGDMFSDNRGKHLRGTTLARKVLSREDRTPYDMFIQAGVVQRCVQFIGDKFNPDYLDYELQFESGRILANLSSGTSELAHFMVACGVVKPLIRMLRSPNVRVARIAVLVFANITGKGVTLRDHVLDQGVVLPLVALVQQVTNNEQEVEFLRALSLTMSNICRGTDHLPSLEVIRHCLVGLAMLIQHEDPEVVVHASKAVSYISDGRSPAVDAIIKTGIVPRLVQLLSCSQITVVVPCLRTISNIAYGNETQVQSVLNAGVLPHLANLLVNGTADIRKYAILAISNIACQTPRQIRMIFKTSIVPSLIGLLPINNIDYDTKHGAIGALRNITCEGSLMHLHLLYLDKQEFIPALCYFLPRCLSTHTIILILESLQNMLMAAHRVGESHKMAWAIIQHGGYEVIKNLRHRSDSAIQKKASVIFQNFFAGWET